METKNRTTYRSALFSDPTAAEAGYASAVKRGYRPEDINVIMSDETRKKFPDSTVAVKSEKSDQSLEGLAIGGALGGAVMGTVASILAMSSNIVVPGLGLVIAGPLAAGLVGVGAGSVAGGLIGALVGAGFTEEHAKIYENGVKQGGVVVMVPTSQKDAELLDDWKKSQARDVF